ncbi:DUF1269 domain-containing protein [Pasteurellaceae bacterium LIM206]|nr:DUF1269 domain-containing protein [Pasteurellaceae bacterium LIM206]
MQQNVIVSLFEVESEAYQAFNELKVYRQTTQTLLAQAVLVKKNNGILTPVDAYDPLVKSADAMLTGGLIGALIGVLGGPLGVLLGGSTGALIGSSVESADALKDGSLIAAVAGKLKDGDVAILLLAQEADDTVLNQFFGQFKTTVVRWDAADIQHEIDEAVQLEISLREQAEEKLKAARKQERKANFEQFKNDLKKKFDEIADKVKNALN